MGKVRIWREYTDTFEITELQQVDGLSSLLFNFPLEKKIHDNKSYNKEVQSRMGASMHRSSISWWRTSISSKIAQGNNDLKIVTWVFLEGKVAELEGKRG